MRQCLKKANEFKDFGNDKVSVTLNIIKRIICIQGEQKAANECEGRVRNLLTSLPRMATTIKTANNKNPECPVCMGVCETPYALQQCGHIYCRACLYDFFTSRCNSTLSLNAFKICCLADGCNVSCLIRDIKSVLGAHQMEQLAKVVFQIYLKQSSINLAQCVGNDCLQVSYSNIWKTSKGLIIAFFNPRSIVVRKIHQNTHVINVLNCIVCPAK